MIPEYRGKAVDAMLYHWIWTRSGERGIYWGEAGWILEDNPADERGTREDDLPGVQDLSALRSRDMKALVTGATGFVGSHLAEALRSRGIRSRRWSAPHRKAAALEPLGVRVVPGDLDDAGSLARAVEGQDVVFHVAGLVAAKDEAEFLRVNRDGTASLVAAAARARVGRFVYVSSMAAGWSGRQGPSAHRHGDRRAGDRRTAGASSRARRQ